MREHSRAFVQCEIYKAIFLRARRDAQDAHTHAYTRVVSTGLYMYMYTTRCARIISRTARRGIGSDRVSASKASESTMGSPGVSIARAHTAYRRRRRYFQLTRAADSFRNLSRPQTAASLCWIRDSRYTAESRNLLLIGNRFPGAHCCWPHIVGLSSRKTPLRLVYNAFSDLFSVDPLISIDERRGE